MSFSTIIAGERPFRLNKTWEFALFKLPDERIPAMFGAKLTMIQQNKHLCDFFFNWFRRPVSIERVTLKWGERTESEKNSETKWNDS